MELCWLCIRKNNNRRNKAVARKIMWKSACSEEGCIMKEFASWRWFLWIKLPQTNKTLVKLTYIHAELGTSGGKKFDKYAHPLKILLYKGASVMGKSPSKMWNFFKRPMALLTCILSNAIFLVSSTSVTENCFLSFPKNGWIFKVTFLSASNSSISNPLSAITLSSPGSRRSRIPLFWTSSLSEDLPYQRSDTNVKAPEGLTPTRALNVAWLL